MVVLIITVFQGGRIGLIYDMSLAFSIAVFLSFMLLTMKTTLISQKLLWKLYFFLLPAVLGTITRVSTVDGDIAESRHPRDENSMLAQTG